MRINAPVKRVGHSLTNQLAERINSFSLSGTIFSGLFCRTDKDREPGPKATVKLISARFFWPNMSHCLDTFLRILPKIKGAHTYPCTPRDIQHPRRSVQPYPYRSGWTMAGQSRIYLLPDLYRPFYTMA